MELRHLTDQTLLLRLEALVSQERGQTADVVEHILEVDRRAMIAGTGYPTLFRYCTQKLRYSEQAAFSRIRAARAASRYPRVLEDLRSGALHLDAILRIYPHLTDENCADVLDAASGATKRQVMALAASLSPPETPVERDVVRFLPPPKPPVCVETKPEIIPPPSRVRLGFTADETFLESLDRLKSLRRHEVPDGSLEPLLIDAVEFRLRSLEPKPVKPRKAPNSNRRRITPTVKAFVWKRDGGACTFVSAGGIRCLSKDFLEYDHVKPWSLGGRSTADNLRLLCRPHNQHEAKRLLGTPAVCPDRPRGPSP